MKVVPLTITLINWPNLLQSAKNVTGRSPVAILDEERNSERTAYAFISALSELKSPGEPTREAIKNIFYYHHYSVGFLVECSPNEADNFRPLEGLLVSYFPGTRQSNLDLLIISGTLSEWIPLIKYYRSGEWSIRQEFFEQVYQWLGKLSLKEIL